MPSRSRWSRTSGGRWWTPSWRSSSPSAPPPPSWSGWRRSPRPPGRRPTPEEVLATPEEELRARGLSRAKAHYVKELASAWLEGALRQEEIPRLPDDEVVELLTRVKGVGRWTAEMILVFALARPDVLPVDDLGIRAAVQRWYGLPERPGREELERIAAPWRPHRTLASRYLWRSLSSTPPVAPEG